MGLGASAGGMDPTQEGIVNSTYLTTRLPSWAGARQNVEGSDISGRSVESLFHRHRRLPRELVQTDRRGLGAPRGEMEELTDALVFVAQELDELRAKLETLEREVARRHPAGN